MVKSLILKWSAVLLLVPGLVWSQKPQRKGSMRHPLVFSDQFKHSIGAGASFYSYNNSQEPVFHIDYNPSFSLTNSWSDFSISVGTQLAGGYHFESSTDDTAFVYADLPLLVEFNFGNNASKDFYNDLGLFLGGGYTYHLVRETWNHGPVATFGFRAFVFGPSLTLRYTRFFSTHENDPSLHTITLLWNMGKYFEQVKLNNKISRFN